MPSVVSHRSRIHKPVIDPCPCSHLFWEYDASIRAAPPFSLAVSKITALGDVADIKWLIRHYGSERIALWLTKSRVIGADKKSVNLMCLAVGVDIKNVHLSPDWIQT